MKRFAPLALALLLAPAASSASNAPAATPNFGPPYPINPGYWEVTTNWLGLIHTTERWCVEPKNISRFLSGPCNHIYHCNYPVQEYGDGKAHFDGYIRGNDELYHVHGGGTYSPTSMDMKVSGTGHWHIVPITDAKASLKAHFLGDSCPASAKRIVQRPQSQ